MKGCEDGSVAVLDNRALSIPVSNQVIKYWVALRQLTLSLSFQRNFEHIYHHYFA